jgi:NAD(P)-dependent dehydrogenase (short-subunit alcohol dehydrogenase family)
MGAPVLDAAGGGFPLAGRVAVVTGAAGLLGREHCRALADAGATVVATDLDAGACAEVEHELASEGRPSVRGFAADITDEASLLRLRQEVLRREDRLDILVNNAALNEKVENDTTHETNNTRFESFPVEQFRRILEVNVTGTFLACQILGAEMARRGSGSIINIASTYGHVAPDQRLYRKPDGSQTFWKSAGYPASKGAVLSFTRFLAAYWADRGVRVNSLSPGGVGQPGQDPNFVEAYASRTPLARMAAPHEYRAAIVFLASDGASYMTGADLIIDGGWTAW